MAIELRIQWFFCPEAISSSQVRFALLVSLIQNSAPQREQIGIQGYFMNLHEYQSKQLFAQYGIPMPPGQAASSPEEAVVAARQLGGPS
jgi:acyl-CoA synthetase (NDP forming)